MMSSSTNDTYANESTCSIRDFMSGRRFSTPAVVRVTPSDYEIPDSEDFPRGAELLLDKLDQVKYARIKVLPFTKEERVITAKGTEFVRRRSELVGREFFLPAEYHGNERCIPRPGYRKSCTSISQVLEDLPRYVKVCVDTPSCGTSGELDLGPKICSGTVLLIRKIYTVKNRTLRYLICSYGDQHFHFREDQQVKMDTVGDGQLHLWSELENLAILPVCVQFEYVNPNDVVFDDDEAAETLLAILTGPIEVTKFVTSDMLLGWTSNGENKPCTNVVLLRKTARDVPMRLEASMSNSEGRDYIHKHFDEYWDTKWLRSCMYALNANLANKERFVWLKRCLSSVPEAAGPITARKPIDSKPVAKIRPSVRSKVAPKPISSSCSIARTTVAPKPRPRCSGGGLTFSEYVQGCIANNEATGATESTEAGPSSAPQRADHSGQAENDTKWVEWNEQIRFIHSELLSSVRNRSSSNLSKETTAISHAYSMNLRT